MRNQKVRYVCRRLERLLFGPGFDSPHLHSKSLPQGRLFLCRMDRMICLDKQPSQSSYRATSRMRIEFTKMTGAGNDFVVIDNRSGLVKNGAELAQKLCDRRWGVGADGLLLLESSEKANYRMMYYNADGSYGGMCGNGGRCLAQYAYLNRIAQDRQKFEALDHVYSAAIEKGSVTLSMKSPMNLKWNMVLPLARKKIKCHFVDTGSPHVVIPVRKGELAETDVPRLGRKIRFHKKLSPAGTNVNFVEKGGGNSVKIRTYERGVENETLACGTGSIASAIIAHKIWGMIPPISVIPASRVELHVDFTQREETYTDVKLTGPASIVFTGTIDV